MFIRYRTFNWLLPYCYWQESAMLIFYSFTKYTPRHSRHIMSSFVIKRKCPQKKGRSKYKDAEKCKRRKRKKKIESNKIRKFYPSLQNDILLMYVQGIVYHIYFHSSYQTSSKKKTKNIYLYVNNIKFFLYLFFLLGNLNNLPSFHLSFDLKCCFMPSSEKLFLGHNYNGTYTNKMSFFCLTCDFLPDEFSFLFFFLVKWNGNFDGTFSLFSQSI